MKQYLDLCSDVLAHGEHRKDRTGTGTISVFGTQTRYDLQDGFPLLTTKKMFLRPIAEELLWFLKGDTNIHYLVTRNVKIWNDWPYEKYRKCSAYQGESMEEFVEKIKNDSEFAKKYGDLGPIYGKQWRDFNGQNIDQIKEVIQSLKQDPFSRRHIISAWNPAQIKEMALPPCHAFVQFYVSSDQKYLSAQLYQRSADIFLGVPFNIASYSLLTHMMAQICGYQVKEFIHTIGDAHIYNNHITEIKTQIGRTPLPKCQLQLNPAITSIFDFTIDDISVTDYQSHSRLVGKVSV